MNLRRIRHFVVLAETLNYRRAAELLHMAQPPLTISIQKLEKELGTKLFERGHSGVALTAGGRSVLLESRKLLFHSDQLQSIARDVVDGTGGKLQVGFVGTTTYGLLQRLLPQFRNEYPGVTLELREETSVSILDQLENYSLNIGLIRTPLLRSTQATLVQLEQDQFIIALPRSHPLGGQGSLHLSELSGESFVMYNATAAAGLQCAAMLACQEAGFVPRISQVATQVQTLLAMVECGIGVALVPSIMQRFTSSKLLYRPLEGLSVSTAIGFALAYMKSSDLSTTFRFKDVAERICFLNQAQK